MSRFDSARDRHFPRAQLAVSHISRAPHLLALQSSPTLTRFHCRWQELFKARHISQRIYLSLLLLREFRGDVLTSFRMYVMGAAPTSRLTSATPAYVQRRPMYLLLSCLPRSTQDHRALPRPDVRRQDDRGRLPRGDDEVVVASRLAWCTLAVRSTCACGARACGAPHPVCRARRSSRLCEIIILSFILIIRSYMTR